MRLIKTVSGLPLLQDGDRLLEFSGYNFHEIQPILAVEPDLYAEVVETVKSGIKEAQSQELLDEPEQLKAVIDMMTNLHTFYTIIEMLKAADSLRSQIESEQADAPEKVS